MYGARVRYDFEYTASGRWIHDSPERQQLTATDWSRVVVAEFDAESDLAVLPELLAAGSLHTLILSKTEVSDAHLSIIGQFTGLRRLFLAETNITDAGVHELSGLKALRRITLSKTKVTDAALATLGRLFQLESLLLVDARVGDRGIAELSSLTNLKLLWLDGTNITDAALPHLVGASATWAATPQQNIGE